MLGSISIFVNSIYWCRYLHREGYLIAQKYVHAPNTLKQFTSDKDYTGTAKGTSKQISYEDIYNATICGLKEEIFFSYRIEY